MYGIIGSIGQLYHTDTVSDTVGDIDVTNIKYHFRPVTKMVSKNHLPGFSTLASNSVIGGAEGGSLLITSDGALDNHTHLFCLDGTSIVS